MNKPGNVFLGLLAFLIIAILPFLYTNALGNPGPRPELELPPGGETNCVEEKNWMNNWHMDLLNSWRDEVVRNGQRIYVSNYNNEEHEMSLTKTCLKCHSNKDKFCDRCHNYADVSPYCWDCHVEPQGE